MNSINAPLCLAIDKDLKSGDCSIKYDILAVVKFVKGNSKGASIRFMVGS